MRIKLLIIFVLIMVVIAVGVIHLITNYRASKARAWYDPIEKEYHLVIPNPKGGDTKLR